MFISKSIFKSILFLVINLLGFFSFSFFFFLSFSCSIKEDIYTFAECFLCRQTGHLTRTCPSNPRGIYPHGGGCFRCGDKTHMSKSCPGTKNIQDENVKPEEANLKKAVVGMLDVQQSADADVAHIAPKPPNKANKQKTRVVKF